jgi:hypothetical protein
LITGVVDPKKKRVTLYVDAQQKATAPRTADTLDDTDKTDLVVGAGSGVRQFGHGFIGQIRDVHLYPRVLSLTGIKALFARKN